MPCCAATGIRWPRPPRSPYSSWWSPSRALCQPQKQGVIRLIAVVTATTKVVRVDSNTLAAAVIVHSVGRKESESVRFYVCRSLSLPTHHCFTFLPGLLLCVSQVLLYLPCR